LARSCCLKKKKEKGRRERFSTEGEKKKGKKNLNAGKFPLLSYEG